jgi:hypothetical protein
MLAYVALCCDAIGIVLIFNKRERVQNIGGWLLVAMFVLHAFLKSTHGGLRFFG